MENRGIRIEKIIEFILGLFFLIPSILSVVAFIMLSCGMVNEFSTMSNLSGYWTCGFKEPDPYMIGNAIGEGMSSAPIYCGMMAFVCAFLIKDSFRFFYKP